MAQSFALIGKVMNKRASDIPKAVGRIVRTAARAAGSAVVRMTPVDTGAARSNWIAAVDSIPSYTIPPYVPYPRTSSAQYAYRKDISARSGDFEETANAGAAEAQHAAAIDSFDPLLNNTIYIANNLPYIGRLNSGYSPQADPGFVQRAVEIGAAAVQRLKLMEA